MFDDLKGKVVVVTGGVTGIGGAAALAFAEAGAKVLAQYFGGGPELAVRDCRKAIQLNPKSAEAYLWLGLALRKTGRMTEARAAIQKSLELNPNRVWAKQQLDKTPVK
ncbi:MAG: tetratricopeptide repeat protein [Hyphomicrobiales bacterium]|nr:MAG: tetratricopeptide repeat protein [Hyphomicrobiales bacterium]